MASMATETAFVRVKLSSVAHPTDGACEIKLIENDARTSAYESGYDAKSMATLSNDYSVLFYGFVGTEKCSDIATNDLTGTALGFTTNNVDTEYKLSFRLFSGNEFYIYDRVAHKSILVNASTPDYTFNAAAGRVEVNDRFVIGIPAAYNVTLNDYGFASFSASESVVVPDDVDAYQAKFVSMNDEVLLTKITEKIIPANTGVILYGTALANHSLAVLTDGTATLPTIALNDLMPSSALDPSNYSNVFVLKGEALYEYVGTTALAANKAYLQLPSGSAAPQRIRMVINEVTAVENVAVESVKAEKFVENGEILIRRGNEVYNLQGQIVK